MKKKGYYIKLYETIADIAYLAGAYNYYSGDNRTDMQLFIHLAKKFEKKYKSTDWGSLQPDELDYMEAVEKFAKEELQLKNKLDLNYPHSFNEQWDNIEIERCRDDGTNTYQVHDEHDKESGDFYSVYVHMVKGGAMCIADVPTEKDADDLKKIIQQAVRTFKDNGFMALYNNDSLKAKIIEIMNPDRYSTYPSEQSISMVRTFKRQIINLFI